MNYKLKRAVAILRAAYSKMATEEKKWRPAAMADLELMGVKTGALQVKHRSKRRRVRAA